MFQKILRYVNQYAMLQKQDKIVAGVSGGADSVCLLFVLQKMREEMGVDLFVAHVNHGLRGEEALQDQEFVRKICEKWNIPFYLKTVDIKQIAAEEKLTEEEAGREVRYAFFREIASRVGGAKIAVGHNANDNAETVLFHLIRGSALKGLGGISPVQGDIIRPLLCVRREEIEAYLEENGLAYCTDKTNLEDVYTRNRIRHTLLPLMEEMNPQVVEAIARGAKACREGGQYLEEVAEEELSRYGSWNEDNTAFTLEKQLFEEIKPALLDEVLLLALEKVCGKRKDIGTIHVDALIALQKKETGKSQHLPYAVVAENEYGSLVLRKEDNQAKNTDNNQVGNMDAPQVKNSEKWELSGEKGEIHLPNGTILVYTVEKYEKSMKIPENRYTKWLDYDIIKSAPCLRTRRNGDWIQVLPNGGRKKLKDYLINEKIPRSRRDALYVLAEESEILWIVGYRISERVKITEKTKRVLKLEYIGGKEDE